MNKHITFISLLLALILLLSITAGYADTEEVIKFRDLEWGESCESVSEKGNLTIFSSNTWFPTRYSITTFDNRHVTHSQEEIFSDSKKYIVLAGYNKTAKEEIGDIAGYTLNDIYLHFVAVPDDNGTYPFDKTHTALYCAAYAISSSPYDKDLKTDDPMGDLSNKLSSVYGNYEIEEGGDYPCYLWRGAENTTVALTKTDNNGILIIYAWEKGDELLNQAQEAMDAKKNEFSQKTNGL